MAFLRQLVGTIYFSQAHFSWTIILYIYLGYHIWSFLITAELICDLVHKVVLVTVSFSIIPIYAVKTSLTQNKVSCRSATPTFVTIYKIYLQLCDNFGSSIYILEWNHITGMSRKQKYSIYNVSEEYRIRRLTNNSVKLSCQCIYDKATIDDIFQFSIYKGI